MQSSKVHRRQSIRRAADYSLDALERRTMLSAALRSTIPFSLDPASTPQALFAPGVSQLNYPAVQQSPRATYLRFAVDNTTAGEVTKFTTTSTAPTVTDAALALFDADGNLLISADQDSPNVAAETLSAALNPGVEYVLGVYTLGLSAAGTAAGSVTLTADTGSQTTKSTIKIDPSTGAATLVATGPADAFTGPADVSYFPIDLTNAGPTNTVTESSYGPDGTFFAQLYRRTIGQTTWTSIAAGSGSTVTLSAAAPAGLDATDAQYVLATSPLNFNTAPEPLQVTLQAGKTLVPSTTSPLGLHDLGELLPGVPGTASAAAPGFGLAGGQTHQVRAAVTGPMTVVETNSTNGPLVGIYDATGSTLIAVGSSTATVAGSATVTFNASAGANYLVRSLTTNGNNTGTVTMTASQAYTPLATAAAPAVQSVSSISLDAADGGAIYRITPGAADFLILQITPDAGSTAAPRIYVSLGASTAGLTATAAAGANASLAVDLGKNVGPFDVLVTGTGGTGTGTFSYAAVTLPKTLNIGQLPTQNLSLNTGSLSATAGTAGFGNLVGIQYYLFSSSSQILTVTGTGGAVPIAARYVMSGTTLKLDDKTVPVNGGNTATMSPAAIALSSRTLYALAAIPINLDGDGAFSFSVAGTVPVPVSIDMVPDPAPLLSSSSHQPVPPVNTSDALQIHDGFFKTAYQRDFWQTMLPPVLNSTPLVTFAPANAGQPVAATVTVLDAGNNVLGSGTSTAGGTLTLNLTSAVANSLVRFLVEPVAGQPLGDGEYDLSMTVTIPNPADSLVTEQHFQPPTLRPTYGQLPFYLSVVNVPFNGTAGGSFTSSASYYGGLYGNTGAIAVYSFTEPDLSTPFHVWTTDNDTSVRTDIGLYTGNYSSGGTTPTQYDAVQGAPFNYGYAPATHTPIDSQIFVNNTSFIQSLWTGLNPPGVGTFYVVVKNEYGTKGSYTFHVATATSAVVTADPSPAVSTLPTQHTAGLVPDSSTLFLNANRTLPAGTSYSLLTPSPVGTASQSALAAPGVTNGALDQQLFYVDTAGTASFKVSTLNVSNVIYALYAVSYAGGETSSYYGHLVAYASGSGSSALAFTAGVSPGQYYLKLVGTTGGAYGYVTYNVQLPSYTVSQIELDPNSGFNDLPATRQSKTAAPTDLFYRATAPASLNGPLSVHFTTNAGPTGTEVATLWKRTQNSSGIVYTRLDSRLVDNSHYPNVTTSFYLNGDTPGPGGQYYISAFDSYLADTLQIGAAFPVYQSSTPDFAVTAVALTPDNGKTKVTITVVNQSFAVTPSSLDQLTLQHNGQAPLISLIKADPIGPLGSQTFTTDWLPGATADQASFIANVNNAVQEFSLGNNSLTTTLSTVDAHYPTVALALADPAQTGESGVWGRYVAGVSTPIPLNFSGKDSDGDLYELLTDGAVGIAATSLNGKLGSSLSTVLPLNTAYLKPNSSANPNIIRYRAIDAYGLTSPVMQQGLDVVADPSFYSSVVYDAANRGYDLAFNHDVVDYHHTISDILGFDIPVVGSKDNEFLINVNAAGFASLNPATAISLPLASRIFIKALDGTVYDESFNGTGSPADHLTLKTTLAVASKTLDVSAAAISVQLTNLNLFHVQTPLIKLFSFGIPDVASIDAGIKFGFSGDLSAGVKIGINPNFLIDPLHTPLHLGIMSPSFIQPSITGTATVEGDVNVLGFDLASLEGSVGLTLQVTAGLDNDDPSKVFSFDDFFSHLAVKVDAILNIRLEADVLGLGDIWDYDYSHSFPVSDTSH